MSHPRVIVRAGRNSRCTLIEHFVGASGVESFTNAVTTIELRRRRAASSTTASSRSRRARFHIAQVNAQRAADSRYSLPRRRAGRVSAASTSTTLLEGAGAHVRCTVCFAPLGTQHLDVHTRIDHVAPHTTSEEDYRGIAGGRGRGVFNGKVIVRPNAQKTDARQSSRNLLLDARRRDRHQARAGDLRERREVQSRRDDRPARCGRALLPALARPRRSRRARCC